MKFDHFLELHQALVLEVTKGKITIAELCEFEDKINIAIEAYIEIHDSLKYQVKKWNDQCKRLCELRDGIIKMKKELDNAI